MTNGKNKNKSNKEDKKIKDKELPNLWQILEEIMNRFSYDFTKTEYLHLCEEAMLNDIDKKILECKIKGLSYVQIGDTCGMSPDNVKKRISKIKKKLLRII